MLSFLLSVWELVSEDYYQETKRRECVADKQLFADNIYYFDGKLPLTSSPMELHFTSPPLLLRPPLNANCPAESTKRR